MCELSYNKLSKSDTNSLSPFLQNSAIKAPSILCRFLKRWAGE